MGSNATESKIGSLSSYGGGGLGGISSAGSYGGTTGFGSSSTKKGGRNDWANY